ncbi:GPW/gp25 family protein [Aquimarina sp. MMG016]|uniref:GPW/gp25 family protein n=1 Tax=Aquimarina sp. MMG016 TaxID=2822690 RepID=UPI001B3A07E0|nr:GPW/gp25 family protein [Aquimarina sp. MMG016]MBQ4820698.1 GPW/gp25 family protein [Aquimarina sp. MMG016]
MENKFLGVGWAFPPEFFEGGAEVKKVSGEEDIKQSLQILLSTTFNERLMNAGFGCDLNQFLFEQIDQGFSSNIKNVVSDAILNHEPRIKLDEVIVDNADAENGLITLSIAYTVRMTNNRFNLVYPFYVNEASAIAFEI